MAIDYTVISQDPDAASAGHSEETEALLRVIRDVAAWAEHNNTQIKFEQDSYNGSVGVPITVNIILADGDGTPCPFSETASITAAVTAPATITESQPVNFVRSRDGNGNLQYLATINVTSGSAGAITLSLTDSVGSGLDVTHQATVNFS